MSRFALSLLFAATTAHAAITGSLVDELGKPVAGATVRAYAAESSHAIAARLVAGNFDRAVIASAESGQNGTFKIEVKAPAAELVIETAGQQPLIMSAADGDALNVLVLHPKPGQKIHLVANGKSVANAPLVSGPFVTRSDAQGNIELPDASTAQMVVHPDFAVTPAYAYAAFGSGEPVDVTLSRGTAIRGRILGTDGQPVANAVVTVARLPLARSAADGTFTIAHAPSNWRTITVTEGSRAGSAANTRAVSYDIRLKPGASISGTTVPGSRISITQSGDNDLFDAAIADASGKFMFDVLPAGRYTIRSNRRGYGLATADVTLQDGAHITQTLTPKPLPLIRGRVVDEEKKPVESAFVWYGSLNARDGFAVTGANGEFAVRRVEAGGLSNAVFAVKSGYALGSSALAQGKADAAVTLPRGFPLQVRVIDRQRKSVGGASVSMTAGAPDDFTLPRAEVVCERPLSTTCRNTSDNGMINVRAAEGQYTVRVSGRSIVPKTLPVQALTAQSSPLTIEVDRGVEVSGTVQYADRTPVSDAYVTVRPFGLGMPVRTEADGSFKMRNVLSGKLSLVANASGLESAPVDVEAPARGVVITIPAPARIEGRVTDKETGQPITDFQVAYNFRESRGGPVMQPLSVHADDGAYILDRVPAGGIDLQFVAAAHARGTVTGLTTAEGQTLRGVDVQLDKGGSIRGRVTASGEPQSGVFVQFGDTRGMRMMMRGMTMVATDSNGEYVLEGAAEGDRTIEFMKDGFVRTRKKVEVARGKEVRLDVELERGQQLEGRVIDKNGQPLAGARVSAMPLGGGMGIRPVTSDASGAFTLSALDEGRYTISAAKQGYVSTQANDVIIPATAPVTLTLDTGGTIMGRIAGLTPAELAVAEVSAGARGTSSHAPANTDGTFTLHGIPDGRVTIYAFVRGGTRPRQSMPQSVDVANGSAPAVQIDFNQGITITGRVTRNGVALPSGSVNFNGRGASLASDGTYQAEGLTPGDYTVTVWAQSGILYRGKYKVEGNSTYDIAIQGASLRGRVVDAATGAPVSDAMVLTNPSRETPTPRQAMSDSAGYFTLEALADGTYQLRVNRDPYAPALQNVTVAGGSAAEVEIRLDKAQPVVFRVTDAQTGAPIDAMISVMDGRKQVAQTNGVRDDDGVIRVYVGPGHYGARLFSRGYAQETVDFSAPGPEVRVPLMLAGRILLVASKATRVGVTRVTSAVPGPGGVVRGGVSYTAGPSGTLVDTLTPGTYSIDVFGSSGTAVIKSVPAMVISGQTTTINVD